MLQVAQPRQDYLCRSPLGTRLFQLTLSRVERLLCAASTLEELAVLNQLMETTALDDLPVTWLRHWGEEDAAQVLESVRSSHTALHIEEEEDHEMVGL